MNRISSKKGITHGKCADFLAESDFFTERKETTAYKKFTSSHFNSIRNSEYVTNSLKLLIYKMERKKTCSKAAGKTGQGEKEFL